MIVLACGKCFESTGCGRGCEGMLVLETFAETVVLEGGKRVVLADTSNY